MSDCIFCKIVAKQIPAQIIDEDDSFLAFKDLNPQAKTHILIIPKKHFSSMADMFPEGASESQRELAGRWLEKAVFVARSQGLLPGGFRTVINTEKGAGQSVFHVHLHLLGGKPLSGHFG